MMRKFIPPSIWDLLGPVLVVFASFLGADLLHRAGLIDEVSADLLAAFIGVFLAWAVAVILHYSDGRKHGGVGG